MSGRCFLQAVRFILLLSRQGKVRLAKWYTTLSQKERAKITKEVTAVVLARAPKLCNFVDWKDQKIVYKRYASLYFIAGIDQGARTCRGVVVGRGGGEGRLAASTGACRRCCRRCGCGECGVCGRCTRVHHALLSQCCANILPSPAPLPSAANAHRPPTAPQTTTPCP